MIGRFLCRVGLHRWRLIGVHPMPALPTFPKPRLLKLKCRRCAKRDWSFSGD